MPGGGLEIRAIQVKKPPLFQIRDKQGGVLKKTIISLRNPYIELQIWDKQGGFLKRGGFLTSIPLISGLLAHKGPRRAFSGLAL